jgi:type VI secretion system protein ImpG
MDARLLRHYEAELGFMREMGAEFAAAYPKIAGRLGMDGAEVLDPYVERLMEGFAFLAARVQLELELQFPAFTGHLLEIVYPHLLAPTPSMMIAALTPDPAQATLDAGFRFLRHTPLRSRAIEDVQSACVFRTAAEVVMWPIEIREAAYIDGRADVLAAGVGRGVEARAAVRLRLGRIGGGSIAGLAIEDLTLFLAGKGGGRRLHEALAAQAAGLAARAPDRRADWVLELPEARVAPRGFEREEALLPTPARSFDGYRLLQEYFALPQRFHFVELRGIGPAIRRAEGAEVDLYVLLREGAPELGPQVTREAFVLNAVPAINLFPKRCDRVPVGPRDVEQHVVADRTAPMDFEVYGLERVTGVRGGSKDDVSFRPFYDQDDFTPLGEAHEAYYTVRRRMRQRSERERLRGARAPYLGSETYVTLVDRAEAPYGGDVQQLAVSALCTNRDLPMLLPAGEADLFHLPDGGPVASVSTPVPPTRPQPTLAQGAAAWRLISHLSLNYLSIADTRMGGGAEALREIVGVYAPLGDRATEKQLEGLVGVTSRPVVRRMHDEVLTTAVRGLEITLEFDDSAFEGASAFLLGAVLDRFLQRYVTINSFVETVLRTQQRGEIWRSAPARGSGRLI